MDWDLTNQWSVQVTPQGYQRRQGRPIQTEGPQEGWSSKGLHLLRSRYAVRVGHTAQGRESQALGHLVDSVRLAGNGRPN